jgi:hypothetical protein
LINTRNEGHIRKVDLDFNLGWLNEEGEKEVVAITQMRMRMIGMET